VFSLEPARTPYDLHFRVLGIPARIHPGFWLVSFILGYQGAQAKPLYVLIYIGVVYFSILVHELGHALMMRRYGYSPRIVLYHMGGLAIPDEGFSMGFSRPRRDTWPSILILLAGPGAGFLLAAWTALLLMLAGGSYTLVAPTMERPLFWVAELPDKTPDAVRELVDYLFFINIFWGLVNLVPVLPLDGGQIARELLTYRDKYNGTVQAVQLSIAVGIVMAVLLWVGLKEPFAAIMFALLAISNYLLLQQLGRNW